MERGKGKGSRIMAFLRLEKKYVENTERKEKGRLTK